MLNPNYRSSVGNVTLHVGKQGQWRFSFRKTYINVQKQSKVTNCLLKSPDKAWANKKHKIYVKEFKRKQFSFEIGPKWSQKDRKSCPRWEGTEEKGGEGERERGWRGGGRRGGGLWGGEGKGEGREERVAVVGRGEERRRKEDRDGGVLGRGRKGWWGGGGRVGELIAFCELLPRE